MLRISSEPLGNPASSHTPGRQARRVLEDAREQVAGLLGASPSEVLFTSGATDANNLAIFGFVPRGEPAHIFATKIEHNCVTEPLRILAEAGATIEWMPVDARGVLVLSPPPWRGRSPRFAAGGGAGTKDTPPPDSLRESTSPSRGEVKESIRLVCLMLANHETGAIQPVKQLAKLLPPGVPLHTDAAQAVGKIPVNFRDLGATSLSASAHKFRGPVGIGLLLLKDGTKLKPHTFGGHQQRGIRPGTEPVALAVGLATALEYAMRNMARHLIHGHALRARFLAELRKHECPFVLNGPAPGDPDGLPSTLNISFPGARAELLLMALDLAGIACSTGSACSSGSLLPSPVLQAMNVPDDVLQSAMRFSFNPTQSEAEIADAAARVAGVVKAME